MDGLLRATGQFKRINLVQLSNAGLTTLLALLLTLSGRLNLINALVILGIGTSVASFLVGRRLLPAPLDLRPPDRTIWKPEQMNLLRFSRWIAISNVTLALSRQLDVILINRWHNSAAAGLYFLALNLATKIELINLSQHTVLVPMAAKLEGRATMTRYLRQRLQRNGLIALCLLPIWLLVEPLVLYLYGLDFMAAVPLFRGLFLVVLFDFLTLPVTLLFLPLNRPNLLTLADLVQTVLFVVGAFWLIPLQGPIGAIIARAVAKVGGFLVALGFLKVIASKLKQV
jgi:O-antigen/teichoic acid export membrane protein